MFFLIPATVCVLLSTCAILYLIDQPECAGRDFARAWAIVSAAFAAFFTYLALR